MKDNVFNDNLTNKQRLFCYFYIETFNIYSSCLKAGYSKNFAKAKSYKLLHNPKIKKFLEELKQELNKHFFISKERILNRHLQIAFSDMSDFINPDGTLKEGTDGSLIKKITICTEKIKTKDRYTETRRITIEVENRKDSLRFLVKYIGVDEKNKNSNPISINVV